MLQLNLKEKKWVVADFDEPIEETLTDEVVNQSVIKNFNSDDDDMAEINTIIEMKELISLEYIST